MARTTFPPLKDDFSQALLRSAEVDEPSNAAYAKAAAALGVGAGLGVGASLAAPSAVAAGAAGIARWSGSTAVRAWALGVSGALLVGGGALLLTARAPSGPAARASNRPGAALQAALPASVAPPRAAESSALAAPAASAPVTPAPAEASLDMDAPLAAGSSAPHVSGSAVRRSVRAAAALAAPGSSLAEQVQSLDRARVALGSGDASSALQEIAHYRKAWPQGVFLTEASVLEIEALAARGQRSLAASRAAAFVAAHPDSPQADRLRRLIPAEKP